MEFESWIDMESRAVIRADWEAWTVVRVDEIEIVEDWMEVVSGDVERDGRERDGVSRMRLGVEMEMESWARIVAEEARKAFSAPVLDQATVVGVEPSSGLMRRSVASPVSEGEKEGRGLTEREQGMP